MIAWYRAGVAFLFGLVVGAVCYSNVQYARMEIQGVCYECGRVK